jgi:two-component sensor histidine kinase
MPTMASLLRERTLLPAAAVGWLNRLVAEWRLVADLSFADLVLWVADAKSQRKPRAEEVADGYVAAAQVRPTTGPTVYADDLLGQSARCAKLAQLRLAAAEARIARESDPVWLDGVPVRDEAIPVRYGDAVIAVVSRDTNLATSRAPSRLELAYLDCAGQLAQMIGEGRFPYADALVAGGRGPRVGDGLIRLDPAGRVSFASPNALSAYRRLGLSGDLAGRDLATLTAALAPVRTPIDEPVAAVTTGRAPGSVDVENAGAVVALRAVPLRPGGETAGAVVLVQDATELRRRERQLVSKDATIREIHHRVKNNLQTVAALLRLQARRLELPAARAALEESVRRIASIALVHETLSLTPDESVGFDAVADRVLMMVADVTTSPGAVSTVRQGRFGTLPAAVATPLALVLTELVQNAVEHGLTTKRGQVAGTLAVHAERDGNRLTALVVDDGAGLPAGFRLEEASGLGLHIVRTLVEAELGGTITVGPADGAGTRVEVGLPLPATGQES